MLAEYAYELANARFKKVTVYSVPMPAPLYHSLYMITHLIR